MSHAPLAFVFATILAIGVLLVALTPAGRAADPQSGRTGQRMLPTSPELIRGNPAGKLALGAHGIEFFNFFCADEPHHNADFKQRDANYSAIRGVGDMDLVVRVTIER